MGKPAETTTPKATEIVTPSEDNPNDDKHSFHWGWIAWPCVVLFLYVLSTGPMLWMKDKKGIPIPTVLMELYAPVAWAYEKTPLHKPLGLYLRIWIPDQFNANGDSMARSK